MTSLAVTIMAAHAPTSDEIGRVVECERRSPQQPSRAIKCYAIVEAIDFDTGFASFVLGDNPTLSSMPPISSLPPLMVCGVGGRLVASLSLCGCFVL
ncbi:hypothetical protein Tco_0368360 [Tanacetum coccineum]